MENERIICAATKVESKIFLGHRHNNSIAAMNDELSWEHSRKEITEMEKEQGFFTNKERFVSREEALKIALKEKQVIDESKIKGDGLFSEDLY